MNFAALNVQHENQRRLSEALRNISDENARHPSIPVSSYLMPNHCTFFGDAPNLLPSSSDFSLSSASQDNAETEPFPLELYEQPDDAFAYDPIAMSPANATLQVDHHGTKVDEPASSSSWIPTSVLSDTPCSTSVCSSMDQSTKRITAPHATVFAAAITAAMIMENSESVPKRPRSPSHDVITDDYEGTADAEHDDEHNNESTDDNTTEASLDESEDVPDADLTSADLNRSPRAISSFSQMPIPAAPVHKPFASVPTSDRSQGKQCPRPESVKTPKPVHPASHTTPRELVPNADFALAQVAGHLDLPQKAALSKKRRAEALERFRRKKRVRCYGRKVRYQIRKRIATTRPRVNGRFARREDAEMQASTTKQ